MIHKDDLVGKYVEFIDRNGAFRIGKVRKVTGNYISIVGVLGRRDRIYVDKLLYWIHHGNKKEDIDISRRKKK